MKKGRKVKEKQRRSEAERMRDLEIYYEPLQIIKYTWVERFLSLIFLWSISLFLPGGYSYKDVSNKIVFVVGYVCMCTCML